MESKVETECGKEVGEKLVNIKVSFSREEILKEK